MSTLASPVSATQSPAAVFNTMRGRAGRSEPALLDALEAVRGSFSRPEDAQGYEVTRGCVARAESFGSSLVTGTVRVIPGKAK